MAKTSNQKLKILYIMKILLEKTDENNVLTLNQIIEELNNYGVKSERKSIYDDIESLRIFGIDIETTKTKTTGYYIASRIFEIPEIKLLVDAVQCSKFITQKKSNNLIKKIERLTNIHEAQKLQRLVYVANRVKCSNESIYYNIDKLHSAIIEEKKVTFKYFDYTVTKEKKYRKDDGKYVESPYTLCWDDENYYLITFSQKHGGFVHYRVDRMTDIEIIEDKRDKIPENIKFDAAKYSKELFNMFAGKKEIVTIQFDNSLINVAIDRFGEDVSIKKTDDFSFTVRVEVAVSTTFFAWLFQFGNLVKILSPKEVADEYKNDLRTTISQY